MCLLAHQCGAWGGGQQQQKQPISLQEEEAQQAAAGAAGQSPEAAALRREASNGSCTAGVGTPPVMAGTPHKCASDSSSLLSTESIAAAAAAAAAAGAASSAEKQQQGRLATRLQQLMSAWEGGRSGGSSAQPSPGAGASAGVSPRLPQLLAPESPLSGLFHLLGPHRAAHVGVNAALFCKGRRADWVVLTCGASALVCPSPGPPWLAHGRLSFACSLCVSLACIACTMPRTRC